jgi:hypothetical protein
MPDTEETGVFTNVFTKSRAIFSPFGNVTE